MSDASVARLRLEDVKVSMKGIAILRGVSLVVEPGEIVGLIGRNGAGKTTTLRTIMGLTPVGTGTVLVDGQDVGPWPAYTRARLGIGYVPEHRGLISALTVRENILIPAWSVRLPDAGARLEALFELMPELPPLAARPAALLSGGQQKLVALARSFVNGSRVILLDEPFEGVAPALSRRLLGVIREFQARRPGLSILLAESEFKWARLLAGRLYTIERGVTAPTPGAPAGGAEAAAR